MELKNQINKNYEENNMITTRNSDVIDLSGLKSFSIQAIIDVDVPADDDIESVTAVDDTVTIAGHGLTTGLKVQLTTTGTLPAGLAVTTDYFIIAVDSDTLSFASSLANALAGTAVSITDAGSGTHTIDVTALAGATITFEKSNDNVNYDAIETATAISADAHVWYEKEEPTFRYFRFTYTLTAGRISSDNHVYAEGVE